MAKLPQLLVSAAPRSDGLLSVCEVWTNGTVILSNGHQVFTPYEKLTNLAVSICQDGLPIWIRIWTTPAGDELIELRRVGGPSTGTSTAETPAASEAF